MKLLKIYRYVEREEGGFNRVLYDALTIPDHGGMSSPIGDDEEFEVYVTDIE